MPRLLSLALFPALGAFCLALAWSWSREEVALTVFGDGTDGVIRATVKVRPGATHDLVTDLDHRLLLRFADGAQLSLEAHNYRLERVVLTSPDGRGTPVPSLDAGAGTHPRLTSALGLVIDELLRGDNARIQRVLRRESDQPPAYAILEVEKRETASGWFGLATIPRTFAVEGDRLRPAGDTALPAPGAVQTTARFSRADPVAVRARRGDHLEHYERRVADTVVEPARRDFILYDEPYATEFLPVYQYAVAGRSYANLSQVGRKGSPFSGFILQAPCRVAFDVEDPAHSILLPYLTAPAPGQPKLNWFSNFCESLFSRWAYLTTFLVFALFFFVVGGLLISLHLKPYHGPHTKPPTR